jgi:hypothetical protein
MHNGSWNLYVAKILYEPSKMEKNNIIVLIAESTKLTCYILDLVVVNARVSRHLIDPMVCRTASTSNIQLLPHKE